MSFDKLITENAAGYELSLPRVSGRQITVAMACCYALALAFALDQRLTTFVNTHLVHRSWLLDRTVDFLSSNPLVKGSFVLAVLYFVWFEGTRDTPARDARRQGLLYTLLVCVPAVAVTRVLAWALPFRARPVADSHLHLQTAFGFNPGALLTWSSFPSDHTVLFFALATGIYLVHRKAGLLLYAHATLIIALPRFFLGVHYFSDLLAGAFLGCAIGYSVKSPFLRSLVIKPAQRLERYSAGMFYACLFYLSAETVVGYDHIRTLAIALTHVAHIAICQHMHLG